ncbi:tumor suppressor candidate 2-like isoform X2 [Leucoraja erinacea]|uniref:tumor suppressor candidate 2-like isoform X2 n=1 Tax=Leucoraja erinaceus TaxID=7782 RepID=UPI0024539622|nr:tumor suppressor candidate 2-like isoform X2 [Leucoraja erinacea]
MSAGNHHQSGHSSCVSLDSECSRLFNCGGYNSSMYYDEDGDLAHEFYEETFVTKNGRKKAKLKRIHKNLIPQGMVKLDHPRIHVDFPVVLCEV